MLLAADADIWRYQPHPEVWLIVVGVIGFGWYVSHVLGPKAVPAGTAPISRRQALCFSGAITLLWLSSDWPIHDISEEYLYSVHMVQHLVITLVVPPLFLLATPEWLARLIVSTDGSSGVWVRRFTRPVVAAVIFNLLVAITHLTFVVNTSIENGVLHYFVHLCIFSAALLMWMPIVSPLPELRASYPAQMIYLFLNSIVPTVPGGFLTFAESPLYDSYDHPIRLWGLSVTDDQQAAGLIMKLGGGIYIWSIIAFLFFKWVRSQTGLYPTDLHPTGSIGPAGTAGEAVPGLEQADQTLTFADVQQAFDQAGAPQAEDSSDRG